MNVLYSQPSNTKWFSGWSMGKREEWAQCVRERIHWCPLQTRKVSALMKLAPWPWPPANSGHSRDDFDVEGLWPETLKMMPLTYSHSALFFSPEASDSVWGRQVTLPFKRQAGGAAFLLNNNFSILKPSIEPETRPSTTARIREPEGLLPINGYPTIN